jgi:hypothetical protein
MVEIIQPIHSFWKNILRQINFDHEDEMTDMTNIENYIRKNMQPEIIFEISVKYGRNKNINPEEIDENIKYVLQAVFNEIQTWNKKKPHEKEIYMEHLYPAISCKSQKISSTIHTYCLRA